MLLYENGVIHFRYFNRPKSEAFEASPRSCSSRVLKFAALSCVS